MFTVGIVPYATALFGIVTLPKPTEPSVPVTVNDSVVVAADSSLEIAALVIWLLVMFPPSVKSTVVPSLVVALMVSGDGVGVVVGVGVGLAVGVAVGAFVGTAVGCAVGVGVGVAVGVGVGVAGGVVWPTAAQLEV